MGDHLLLQDVSVRLLQSTNNMNVKHLLHVRKDLIHTHLWDMADVLLDKQLFVFSWLLRNIRVDLGLMVAINKMVV